MNTTSIRSNNRKQTKIVRIVSVFLAVLMMLSVIPLASSAISDGETVRVTGRNDWVSGFYYDFTSHKELGLGGKHGQHQRLKANGQVAYCVEPGVQVQEGNKTASSIIKGLSDNQQQLIKYAFIYGYNGTPRYGYSGDVEEVATQAIMWAIVKGLFNTDKTETFLNCAFGGKTSSANRDACRAVYYKIEAQMLSHRTIPKFSTNNYWQSWQYAITLDYNPNTGRYEKSIFDDNHVISGYTFSMPGVEFEVVGNWLNIFTTNEFDGSEVVTGERTNNSFSNPLPQLTAMYCVGPGQTTATAVSRNDPVNAYFSLKTEGRGKIQINKHAEQGDSQGMVFNISGNGINMDVTINSGNGYDGYVVVDDLRPGTYTVTEKATGEKYYVEPDYQYTTVTPNNTSNVWFSNNLKRGNIEVRKNAEDGIKSGYQFNISGTAIDGETINETITTNAEGVATKEGLPIGTYTVKELNCPSYMVVPSDQTVTVKYNETSSVTFDNKYKRGDLVLSKTDAETGDIILADDAVFAVSEYNKNTNEYDFVCNLSHSSTLDNDRYGCTDGYYVNKLPVTEKNDGKYRVTEKTAPTGYVTDGRSYDVVISNDGDVIKVNDGTVVNKIQRAQINLTKTDKETNKALSNAVFDIYAREDIIANGVTMFKAGTKVGTLTTGENGKALSNALYLGEYYLKEVSAPTGYVLNKDNHNVSLKYDGQKAEVYIQSETVSNMPQKGIIEISKIDAETDRPIIKGAVYGVYASTDIVVNGDVKYKKDQLVDKVSTDNGKGDSKKLYLGTYYVKELTAPEGYNKNNNVYYVPLMYQGQDVSIFTFKVTDKDVSQKGRITVTKTDSETNKTVKDLTTEFEVYAKSDIIVNGEILYSAGQLVTTIMTKDGVASTENLPLGDYFVKEKTAPVGYSVNTERHDVSLTYDAEKESVYAETTVSNAPQKATITVLKADKETNIPVENAVYVIKAADTIKVNGKTVYRKGEKVAELTTDKNGKATSEPLYIGQYIVTEKSAPKPYVRDKNSYTVDITPVDQNITLYNKNCEVTNLAQKATIKLTKTDKETNKALNGATFNIVAADDITVNGDVKYHKNDIVTSFITDENGVAISPELYLGSYKLIETTAPNGYVLNTDKVLANLEYQGQEVEVFQNSYTAQNAPQKANIEITKSDVETEKPIKGAVYDIFAAEDVVVNGDVKYTKNQLVDTVTTDENGKAVTKYLYLGNYYIVEKTAPYGYVINNTKQNISLTYKGQNVVTFTDYASFENVAQKGVIEVHKSGEVLSSVEKNEDKNGKIYTPVYAVKGLKNAVYDIIANEDIYTSDGTKRASEGEIVDTVKTNSEGVAKSKELYLGSYKIVEKTAPYGMTLNNIPQYVTLSYAGQNESIVSDSVSFTNERQKATVTVDKLLEKDDLYNIGNADEITNVKFGLYANENILADDNTVLPKDGLIEIASADKDGHIIFNSDIPLGKYYVKEVSTDKHYIPSDVKYPVEFNYAGQSVLAVTVTANDGNAVENDIIRGKILGHKVDDDGNSVANATMGLFSTTTTEFTKDTAYLVSKTDENGAFVFDNVPYGDYIVREIEAPEGFVLSEKSTPVSVTDNAQTVEIKVLNSIITGNVTVTKVDKEYKDKNIAGAVFDIYLDVNANETYDEGVDTYYGTMTDNHDGTYIAEGLRYNGYFLHEKTAPEGFVADDEYYYFEIRNNNETVTVSNNDENTFEDRPIIGTVEITKTDVATGALIPNVGFRIYDADGNVVAEGYTDENGVATFTLRYGKYTYQEFDAAPGYILDETPHELEIKEDGEIVKADMTNEAIPAVEIPQTGTAGKAIGAFTGLSALSVIGVYFVKKRKSEA